MYKFLTALILTVSLAASAQAGLFARTRIIVRESRPIVAQPVRGLITLAVEYLRARADARAARASASRSVTVTRGPVAESPAVMEARGGILQRAAVHRMLARALRSDRLTAEQKVVAQKALNDPEVYSAVVGKVTKDMGRQFGAIGDGRILEILFANIDTILKLIELIAKLIGFYEPVHPNWHVPGSVSYSLAA